MAIQIYQPMDFPGSSAQTPGFRTWDALADHITAQPLGSIAILLGVATVPVCVVMSDGAGGLIVLGRLLFTAGDGSEFSLGTTGAANIQGLDGVAPTASSSGLDCSLIEGVCRLNFWDFTGADQQAQALYSCSIPNEVDGQVVAIGSGDLYGGVSYDLAGTQWNRGTFGGAPPALLSSRSTSNKVLKPAGGQLVFALIAVTLDSSDRVTLIGGAWDATDPGTATLQATHSSLTGYDLSVPRPVEIYCEGKAAADFSAVLTTISATGGLA